ncbi:hypothetical protein SYJ56_25715 [Algoriphagus sp. D3-2-R+10]|uniref:hypothetical protein n=1 Tax=Algoriphagus aurantiacus TaxID=3103948 RepID=UPI002B3C1056|nr:hypothetical protein [Algoriphagus sp. D3-2-R+10]MEB2778732.1 hypothetical protein [Algoriphagus sp. D3-2-R+10]
MIIYHLILVLIPFLNPYPKEDVATREPSFIKYHQQIIKAETLLSVEKFKEALAEYEKIVESYDFVFLRDYKIASQLALYIGDEEKALYYIQKGISSGWDLKELKTNKFLKPLHRLEHWKSLELDYKNLHGEYLKRLNLSVKDQVQTMFKRDQAMALGALLRISDKAQVKYADRKFAPHSEDQLEKLIRLLENHGYPGEQLIGNNFWVSTIVSHHNSISQEYGQRDTLYNFIRPMLIQAIDKGQISPFEFALADDWKIAVLRTGPGYGFLNPPTQSTLSQTNELRSEIGLRSVELRNKLIEVEHKTGLNFYLPDWVKGKIVIE